MTPEEDKIPVKIWPLRPPRLALESAEAQRAPTAAPATPPQTTKNTTAPQQRTAQVLTDTITRDIAPAVPMVVVSITEGRRLEDKYVERKRDPLTRGSPITDYSAGPDSPTREVIPGKINQIADELAVIRNERERGVKVARNWNPAEPTPTPTPTATPPPAKTTPQSETAVRTSGVMTGGKTNTEPDEDLYEDTAKARPARAITPEPGAHQAVSGAPKGPKGACHGCGKKGHTTQECFEKKEKERERKGRPQVRVFDEVRERTPQRGLGQLKGKGPAVGRHQGRQPESDRRGWVGFYNPPPLNSAGAGREKGISQASR